MPTSPAMSLIGAYNQAHRRVLKLAEQMTDAQLSWRPAPLSHTIAFHLWHIARWADHLQAAISGMTAELRRRLGAGAEIWELDAVAAQWGFDAELLGFAATGMYMPDDVALALPLPDKATLLAYVRRALAAAERAVGAIDDEQFVAAEQPQPLTEGIWGAGTVGDAVLAHTVHINRHLGAIECLYGCQVGSGTATV
jgi:DinB superfamily